MEDFIVYIGISWVVRGGDEEEKDANTGCYINIPKVNDRSELLQFLVMDKIQLKMLNQTKISKY